MRAYALVKPIRLKTAACVPVAGQVGQNRRATRAFTPRLNCSTSAAYLDWNSAVRGSDRRSIAIIAPSSTVTPMSLDPASKADFEDTDTALPSTRIRAVVVW